MSRLSVVTVSLSEIGSSVVTEKLRPLYLESLGTMEFVNADLRALETNELEQRSLVILNLPPTSTEHQEAVVRLRQNGYQGPLLLIVRDLKMWNVDVLDRRIYRNVTFLESPFNSAEAVGLVRRLLALASDTFRVHPRYELEQVANITFGEKVDQLCIVKNVSLGGACIEFKDAMPSDSGSFVTLNINLGQSNESHALRGRVCWIQPYKQLAGVEFIGGIAV